MSGAESWIAPELYQRLRQGGAKANIRAIQNYQQVLQKADVFSFGLTMLQAGIDSPVQGIYGKQGTLNNDVFEKLKQQFIARFGDDNVLLVTTVLSMLEVNPESRPDFKSILTNLPPYAEIKSYFDQ